MPQFMAKRSVMTKFRKMHKVNYRQEGEIVNSPHSYTSLECSTYLTSKDGEIDIARRNEIQVYNIGMRKGRCCYIVGLGLNCKFIDLLFKRSVIKFIKISSLVGFIVSEIVYCQAD